MAFDSPIDIDRIINFDYDSIFRDFAWDDFAGVVWRRDGGRFLPFWAEEPSITAIENVCRRVLHISPSRSCRVSLYTPPEEVGLHRHFLVEYANTAAMMKIILPVDPRIKTESEVATLGWLCGHTSIPVPKVIAFDDTNENEIEFEWILTDFVPGTPVRRKWRGMSMEQKVAFTERVAEIQAELFCYGNPDKAFEDIGTLSMTTPDRGYSSLNISPYQYSSFLSFTRHRILYDLYRGPYRRSYTWLEAQLYSIVMEQVDLLREAEGVHRDQCSRTLMVAQRLLALLPEVFPPATEPNPEPTVLCHEWLSLESVLVDDEGNITAITN